MPAVAVSDAPGAGAVTLGKVRRENNEEGSGQGRAEGSDGGDGGMARVAVAPAAASARSGQQDLAPPEGRVQVLDTELHPYRERFPTSHPFLTVPHQTRV